jgi:cell division protein ZapD
VTDTIIYEQPLNERIRTFLRLEFLFSHIDRAIKGGSELAHRDAIGGLIKVLSVFERSDLKLEIIKELERLITYLNGLENTPGVDKEALQQLLDELDQVLDSLHLSKAGIGQALRDNDFLYAIRQRSSIPGGTCEFDLPAYHFWLEHHDMQQQQQQLTLWLDQFSSVRTAVDTTLRLIRSSTGFVDQQAFSGFYQHTLDSSQPTQLIRVRVTSDKAYYPEISGGKHRFTVRFMQFDINSRAQQVTENVNFQLSCCVI